MNSFQITIVHNARLKVEEQFMRAFQEIPEDKLESLTKHFSDLRFCFLLVEESGSIRHLFLVIPRLLKKTEEQYGIVLDIPNDFIELMNSNKI